MVLSTVTSVRMKTVVCFLICSFVPEGPSLTLSEDPCLRVLLSRVVRYSIATCFVLLPGDAATEWALRKPVYVHTRAHTRTYIHTCMYICLYVCVCVCVCERVRVCVYVCLYMYVCLEISVGAHGSRL